MTFVSYPIADRKVPTSSDEFFRVVARLGDYLADDRGVAIHCRMGIGRSSLVAACLLVMSGRSARQAFESISRVRGIDVPDTVDQIEWVESMTEQLRRENEETN